MSTQLELNKPFQERIFEKIRESIGDLMTDEDLKKLVDATMQKAFFETVKVKTGGSYATTFAETDPLFVIEMRKLMESRVNTEIQTWFAEHPEELTKIIDEKIMSGFTQMLGKQIDIMFQQAMYNFGQNLKQNMGITNY